MPNKKACDLRPTLFTKKKLKTKGISTHTPPTGCDENNKDARHTPFHDETMRNQKSSCLIISQQPVSVQTTLPGFPHLFLYLQMRQKTKNIHSSKCTDRYKQKKASDRLQTIVPPQVLLHLSKTAAQSSPIGFRPCIPSLISHPLSDLVFAPYSHFLCLSDIFIQNTKRIKIQREYEVRNSFLHICQQFCRRKCHFLLQMRRNQTPDILF